MLISGTLSASGLHGSYRVGIWMPDPQNEGLNGDYDLLWASGPLVEHWSDAKGLYRINLLGNVEL